VTEAVRQLHDSGCRQPLLFKFQDRYWILTDNTAVALTPACITDAFEHLIQYFFVLNVAYPTELWIVYGFFETVLGLKPSVGKSVVQKNFSREVLQF